eukprot:6259957-Amphidinium_carterae.1
MLPHRFPLAHEVPPRAKVVMGSILRQLQTNTLEFEELQELMLTCPGFILRCCNLIPHVRWALAMSAPVPQTSMHG